MRQLTPLLALILSSLGWVKPTPVRPQPYYYNWPCGNPQQQQPPWNLQPINFDPCQQWNYYPGYWNGQIFPDCCNQGCEPVYCPPEPEPETEPPPVPYCPYKIPGWNSIHGKTVYLSEPMQLSWYSADAKSMELRASLLKIRSSQDNLLFDAIKPCYPRGTRAWIGGNDLASPGSWAWSDGTPITGYTNFEVNNGNGRCLAVTVDSPKWKRAKCHGHHGSHIFIAEKEVEDEVVTVPTTSKKPPYSTPGTTSKKPPYSTPAGPTTTPGWEVQPTATK